MFKIFTSVSIRDFDLDNVPKDRKNHKIILKAETDIQIQPK